MDMSKGKSTADLLRENKTAVIVIAVALFLIELEIFAVAALKSGEKYKLQIRDAQGNLVHETDGENLSDFKKYYFEKTFGPLENYSRKVVPEKIPFPFRAWFVAAVGIPIGVILLFGFAVKAYLALFHADEMRKGPPKPGTAEYENRFEKIVAGVSRFNIFVIGFLAFLAVILYWIIPNLITYIGQVGVDTLVRFKWVFLGILVAGIGVMVWIIYLKYRLAEKALDRQADVDKYRLKLEYQKAANPGPRLEYHKYEGERKQIPDLDDGRDVKDAEFTEMPKSGADFFKETDHADRNNA